MSKKRNTAVYSMRFDVDMKQGLQQIPSDDIKDLLGTWLEMIQDGTIDIYSLLYQWELDKIQSEIDCRKAEIRKLEATLKSKKDTFKYYQESVRGEAAALDKLWCDLQERHFVAGKIHDVEDIQALIDFCFISDDRCIDYCLNRMTGYEKEYYSTHPAVKQDKENPFKWLKNRLEFMLTDDYEDLNEYAEFKSAYQLEDNEG